MITFHIISLFPKVCEEYFNTSIIGRAVTNKKIAVRFYNPMDFFPNDRLDDKPYGGGPGMVLEALPFLTAFEKARGQKKDVKTIFFSPGGSVLNHKKVTELATHTHIIFFCGHYEGIDERVVEATGAERISIGDYTLSGGELPAMVVADAITRQIPSVLGNKDSLEENRIAGNEVYTRPQSFTWKGQTYAVPDILLSGHHKNIDIFRQKK